MGIYVARRLLNYAILLFVAVSLTYLLAATQLNPRALYEVRNPPLDPVIVEQTLRAKNLSDQVPAAAALLDVAVRHHASTGTGASPRPAAASTRR